MAIVELPKLKCKQCGWKWTPRKTDIRQCPSCRSTYWNDKKTTKTDKKGK